MTDELTPQHQRPGPGPLRPGLLVAASFLLGPLGAGIVLAVNDQRLGLKERPPLTFYLFLFVTLIAYLVLARLHFENVLPLRSRSGWMLARVGLGWVALVFAFAWSRKHRPRFAELMAAGFRPGNPMPVLAPALLAGVLVDMFVWGIFMRQR